MNFEGDMSVNNSSDIAEKSLSKKVKVLHKSIFLFFSDDFLLFIHSAKIMLDNILSSEPIES